MGRENLLCLLELFMIPHKATVTSHKGGHCLGEGRFCAGFQPLRPAPDFQDLELPEPKFLPIDLPSQCVQGDLTTEWLWKNLMYDFEGTDGHSECS
jgi:hypothetical protein